MHLQLQTIVHSTKQYNILYNNLYKFTYTNPNYSSYNKTIQYSLKQTLQLYIYKPKQCFIQQNILCNKLYSFTYNVFYFKKLNNFKYLHKPKQLETTEIHKQSKNQNKNYGKNLYSKIILNVSVQIDNVWSNKQLT